ncbi:MAG TPA: TolC family protein [Steroidobacteraceae bacterium]|nr:TolC family protein [Steroidobacteraceae bacterium]
MRRLVCLLLLVASPLTHAADEATLSFDEAVGLALDHAPQVTAVAEGAAAMRELQISAGRLPDPALIVGVDNLPVEGPDAWSTTADFMTMRNVGLMQEFPSRKKRRAERERASADVGLADAELAESSLAVARETARAWISSATSESTLQQLARLRPELEFGATSARAGVAAGKASTAEALAAAAAAARLETRIVDLQGKARQARAELARWIGADAERPLGPLPAFEALPAPAAALLADAESHGAILPYAARLVAARSDLELAYAERNPDWSAALSYGNRGPAFEDMASLEFTVDLPLFARYRQNPVIAARSADLRRLEAEREAGLRAHTTELRQMLIEWEQSGVQLAQYDGELLPLARERSRAALAAYRSGGADLRFAVDAFEDELELLLERAELADARGRAWAFLRYLEPRQLPG